MKVIYSGLESSGKSYKLAIEAVRLLERNAFWLKKHKIVRPIVSNMHFSDTFTKKAQGLGIPIYYWKDLDELIEYENADVFIDEVGNYFDSRGWESLTLDVRRWLTQGAKTGVDIYGSAQDFAQIDKAFRRLVNKLYYIRKVFGSGRPSPTRPVVKKVWGICLVWRYDPTSYEEENPKRLGVLPDFMTLKRQYTSVFDTNQKIVKSAPPFLKKVVRVCPEDGYKQVRYY